MDIIYSKVHSFESLVSFALQLYQANRIHSNDNNSNILALSIAFTSEQAVCIFVSYCTVERTSPKY